VVRTVLTGALLVATLASCAPPPPSPTGAAVPTLPPGAASITTDPDTNVILIDAPLIGKRVWRPDPSKGEYSTLTTDGAEWLYTFRAVTSTGTNTATVPVRRDDYDLYRVDTHLILRCPPAELCTITGVRA
jgi:hypothetical protein